MDASIAIRPPSRPPGDGGDQGGVHLVKMSAFDDDDHRRFRGAGHREGQRSGPEPDAPRGEPGRSPPGRSAGRSRDPVEVALAALKTARTLIVAWAPTKGTP